MPASKIELPASKTDLPASKIELPASKIDLPVSKIDLPASKIELPASKIDLPASKIDLPASKIELPASKIELPASKIDLPASKIDLPASKIELPASKIELPASKIELPASKIELPASKIDLPASKIDLPASKIELPASKIEVPASKIDLPASKIDLPASKIELPASKIELPASKIELPASKIDLPASKIELPVSKIEPLPSKIEIPPSKIELPSQKTKISASNIVNIVLPPSKIELLPSKVDLSGDLSSPSEHHSPSLSKADDREGETKLSPSQIELPSPPMEMVVPSDIALPPSEIELFLSELEMAPAAIQRDGGMANTTVFYTDRSADAPPLPTLCDDALGSTPEGKVDTQHGKDSPGKSGVVSFTFAKKASTILLPGAVFAKTLKKGSVGKGKQGSGSEMGDFHPGSPPPNCKTKSALDYARFVHSEGLTNSKDATNCVAADSKVGLLGSAAGHNVPHIGSEKTIGDTKDLNVTKKLLEFHSVTSADDTRQLPWPVEMVLHTSVSPSITYCCNPLCFDFTQLRAKPAGHTKAAAESHPEETTVEKKKSHKKHGKKSHSHRSHSERKKRKLLQSTGVVEKTDDNGDETKNIMHKSKKHKHRKSNKTKRHHRDSVGDVEPLDGEIKDTSVGKHNDKEEMPVVDGKKHVHKGKKKKSHRSKKDKKSNPADNISGEKNHVDDESDTKLALKSNTCEKEKKTGDEETSKESELDEMEADGKKKRKYRKRKHVAICHHDSSDDETKTSRGVNIPIPPAVKRKGISSASELSDNAKETKLLEAKLQKNKKHKCNVVGALISSHVHVGDAKAVKAADSVLPNSVGAVAVKALKPAKNKSGKNQHGAVKSDDFDGHNSDSKNKPKDIGKSKWDTSSDSDADNAGSVVAKSAAVAVPSAAALVGTPKDVDRVVGSHSNRSSVRSRKNSGQSEKTKTNASHHSDADSAHDDGDKAAKRKGDKKDHGGKKRSRSRSASSKRCSRSYSTEYEEGRSRSHSYSSEYSDDSDRRRSRSRRRSHTRTPSRRRSRTPSHGRRRSHTRTPSRDRRRSRHGHHSYSSYSRSRSRSPSYSRRSRRRKSRSRSNDRHRRHRSYSRSYSRSRSRSSYSRSRSRSHTPGASRGRHRQFNRERRYNSANVKSLLPKQKFPPAKRPEIKKNPKAASGEALKSKTPSDPPKKSDTSVDTASKSAVTSDSGKTSPSKDTKCTSPVDPSEIPTPTADSIPLPPSGKGKTASELAGSIPLPADDDSVSNIFQPIGPNDPLVFKVPLPPPPPPGKGDSGAAPPLPNGAAPSDEGKTTTEAFMIPPEQVERYKQLRQQAQIHARQRILAQRRLEAGYENDSDEDDAEDEDPQQQLMMGELDLEQQLQLQQMGMLQQQMMMPQQVVSPQPMQHVMSMSPGGIPSSLAGYLPAGMAGLQPAMHMVPQAGAPVMVAAPSMQQVMQPSIVHVMGPGGVPMAVQVMPSQHHQQLMQQQLMQQQLAQQQQALLQQQQLMQQPILVQAGGAAGLMHAATSVVPQLVPVAQHLPNGQVIVGQQLVMQRVIRPHL